MNKFHKETTLAENKSSVKWRLEPDLILNLNSMELIQEPVYTTCEKELNGSENQSRTFLQTNKPNNPRHESRVLVLYTGGTIGMTRNNSGVLVPAVNSFVQNLRKLPQTHDIDYAEKRFGTAVDTSPLVLQSTQEKRRVLYDIHEYDPLLDSSNMTVEHWIRIAKDIKDSYKKYDGFVVLHGTDTLAYTASALSFMLENLGKTVIITGSQVPIFEIRGDGLDNFLASLIIAGNYVVPEVTVFFDGKLFRGNRTIKACSDSYSAFDSPNAAPIATIGIDISVEYGAIFRSRSLARFSVHPELSKDVGLLRLFPSINELTVKSFLQPPIRGVVLQTYGAGNIPSNRTDILDLIKEATSRGVIVVNCTQCVKGSVSDLYETNQVLVKAGVTHGYDMTPEAALTKLAYVLSKEEWDVTTKRKMMESNLRGELTKSTAGRKVWDIIETAENGYGLTQCGELDNIRSIVYPSLLNEAIVQNDITHIKYLRKLGCDFSTPNSDQRTALHVACCEGNREIVNYMLENGASVHVKDRFNRTPLDDAIYYDRHDVIKLLIQCGAHTRGADPSSVCQAAADGDLNRIKSYKLAGVRLDLTDFSGRTPLHYACLCNQLDCVSYLVLECSARIDVKDKLGVTPISISRQMKHSECENILNNCIN